MYLRVSHRVHPSRAVTVGIALFGRMDEALFRRTVLAVLFVAGLGLALQD